MYVCAQRCLSVGQQKALCVCLYLPDASFCVLSCWVSHNNFDSEPIKKTACMCPNILAAHRTVWTPFCSDFVKYFPGSNTGDITKITNRASRGVFFIVQGFGDTPISMLYPPGHIKGFFTNPNHKKHFCKSGIVESAHVDLNILLSIYCALRKELPEIHMQQRWADPSIWQHWYQWYRYYISTIIYYYF